MKHQDMEKEVENSDARERLSSNDKEKLIEKLLGTNDCGEKGIGTMIINKTFYVGGRHSNNK